MYKSGNSNTSKRHHYVPQGYLRGFANEKERISVRPLASERETYISSTKNVAVEAHFHTLEGFDEPDLFEKALSSVEGNAIAIIRKLEAGHFPLSKDDRSSFAYFMALQAVRGPDTRRTIEHIHSTVVQMAVQVAGRENLAGLIEAKAGVKADPELEESVWNQVTQMDGTFFELSNEGHILEMLRLAEQIMEDFLARPWELIRFNRRSLITTDAPITPIKHPQELPHDGVGYQNAWAILMPLTRKLGLRLQDPLPFIKHAERNARDFESLRESVILGRFDTQAQGTTFLANLFNGYGAAGAREYVYFHPEDADSVPVNLPDPNLVYIRASGIG